MVSAESLCSGFQSAGPTASTYDPRSTRIAPESDGALCGVQVRDLSNQRMTICGTDEYMAPELMLDEVSTP